MNNLQTNISIYLTIL